MNNESELSRVARVFVVLAAATMILSVLASLFINLLADPTDPESARNVHTVIRIFNLAALVSLALALFPISRAFSSPLWRICFLVFTFRALMGFIEIAAFLGMRPESKSIQLVLLAINCLSIVAAWMCLGATLIIRRDDGEAGLAAATGVIILVGMSLWIVHFLALLGVLEFSSTVLWITEVAGALTQTFSLLLAFFLAYLLIRAERPAAEARGRHLFYMGATGAILIVTGLMLIWFQTVGSRHLGDWIIFTFAALIGLGLLGAGAGYLGQSLALRKPHGLVAAALVWLQLVFVIAAIVGNTSTALIWITGLLALAAHAAGGISFLQSRKLAAPTLATATGAVLLTCALVSLVLLAFLGERGIDLPWTAQRILLAVALTGAMAAFTLATVHHLQAARR
jgi:hypothetical protein